MEAERRLNFEPGQDTILEFIPFLKICKGLHLLLFGASHFLHLKSHLTIPQLDNKYNLSFSKGTTWGMIIKHVQGENLMKQQKYLGDKWGPYKRLTHAPTYTLLQVRSNDVDQFERNMDGLSRGKDKSCIYWLEGKVELNAAYAKSTGEIDAVFAFLNDELDSTIYLYSKLLPRSWWGPLAMKLVCCLDMYVLRELRRNRHVHVREVWAREMFAKTVPSHGVSST